MASLTNSRSPHHFRSPRSFLIALIFISTILLQLSLSHQLSENEQEQEQEEEGIVVVGRRKLLGFKEKSQDSNSTYDCSPSGPCVACQISEKKDKKYRCSETGYRIPFKCIKMAGATKKASGKSPPNSGSAQEGSVSSDDSTVKHRILADKSSGKKEEYVTYRSCIQGVNEEKLSVLGFEVLVLGLLLVSGSFVFYRRKKTVAMAGVGNVRVQNNSRF